MNGSSVRIIDGDTERIETQALDDAEDPLTGVTDLLISIRRVSDDFYYDFNDNTFKSTGWTTRRQAMTELDATNDPGLYYYDFDTSAITNEAADDTYMVRVEQSPGTTVENLPQSGEIKVDQWPKDIIDDVATVDGVVDDILVDTNEMQSKLPTNNIMGSSDKADHDGEIGDILTDTAAMQPLVSANLDDSISNVRADIAALNDIDQAGVQAALTAQGYTSVRAGLLDNLDQAISSLNDLSIADVQTALTNQGYTALRAAALDNLDAAISTVLGAIGALNDLSQADVQSAMTSQGYTTIRAALLDNLDAAITAIPAAVDVVLSAAHGSGSWEDAGAMAADVVIEYINGNFKVGVTMIEHGEVVTDFDSVAAEIHEVDGAATLVVDLGTQNSDNADGTFIFTDTPTLDYGEVYALVIVATRGLDTWNLHFGFPAERLADQFRVTRNLVVGTGV